VTTVHLPTVIHESKPEIPIHEEIKKVKIDKFNYLKTEINNEAI
jgi:hypothetical protein